MSIWYYNHTWQLPRVAIKAMDAGMIQAERARVRAQEESDRMAEISLNAFERGSKRRKRKKKKSTDEDEE